jgi:hypothetical protein
MPDKITVSQYDEIMDNANRTEKFVKLMEEHTGIVVKPYTAYLYFDPCENYIGCSELQTVWEILKEAGIEVVEDD